MQRTSDSILICVRVDRCWNRYWRCLLLLGFLFLGIILFALLRSGNNSGPMLETNWQKHWSQTQDSAPGSKQVFQSAGSVVNIKNEFVDEYVAQEHDPEPDEGEYYDRDNPDVEQKDSEYMLQYHNDEMMGKQDQARPGSMGVVPEIHDYSLKEKFKQLFKSSPGEDIQFEENYVNPCWPETIPRLPYQNNSYLKVKEQSAVLEPQFQYMRQLFAKRSDPSNRWRLRCLPYFYIMETPPMATPRLYNALRFHPLIVNPDMAEPEFWNQRGPEGTASLKDYLDIFDAASEKIRSNTSSVSKDGRMTLEHRQVTGDGTSSYLWAVDRWRNLLGNSGEPEPKTTVADIIKSLTPNSKIVMVLRNPTERLFQGYISQSENPSASDFHSKTGQALKSMTSCEQKRNIRSCVYDSFLNKRLPVRLRIGMYYPFIQDWINVFGKDQVKVIRYEDYVGNPSEVINDVCSFLQLPPYPTKDLESMEVMIKDMEKKRKANQKLKILSATRAMLKEFHRKLNEQLANLLQDDKFLWPELEVDSDLIKEQLAPTEAQQRELDERQQLQEKERLSREQQAIEQQKRDQQTQEQQTINQQATEQQARNQQAKEQQVREQQAREQQAREQQAREQQAREQQAREQQVREQQAREQQAREQQAREQQTREQQAREQQAREQQAKEQQAKEQQAKEQLAREQQVKEQQAREQQAKEQLAREQQVKEQQAREQQAREQQAREQQAREQQAREQQAKEQQIREQQAREQQAREQQAKEQQAREQQAREQQQFDQQKAQQNQINQQMQQDQRQVTEHQQSQLNQQQGQDQRIQYQAQQSQQQQQQQQQGQIIQHRAQ